MSKTMAWFFSRNMFGNVWIFDRRVRLRSQWEDKIDTNRQSCECRIKSFLKSFINSILSYQENYPWVPIQPHTLAKESLRTAGRDPGLDHLQKYFFDSLCFLEWTWPFWNPWKTFHEKNVWFKQRKIRRKVVPSLTPFGAARAAVQLTG